MHTISRLIALTIATASALATSAQGDSIMGRQLEEIVVTGSNNAVSRIQGNRNPFVDFPNLMEYIWGDSINYAFNPETTLSTSGYGGGGSVTPDPEPTETMI